MALLPLRKGGCEAPKLETVKKGVLALAPRPLCMRIAVPWKARDGGRAITSTPSVAPYPAPLPPFAQDATLSISGGRQACPAPPGVAKVAVRQLR